MKKILLICSLLIINGITYAQKINVPSSLSIKESKVEIDKVDRNAFTVSMAGDEKEIIKAFKDFLEEEKYDVKSIFKKISAEDILVPSFSEKHFNLNAEVREPGAELLLCYWISFGTDIYLDSEKYPEESLKAKNLLRDFAKKYYTEFVNEDLSESVELVEESEEELEDVLKNLSGLSKDEIKAKKGKDKLQSKKLKLEEKLTELNQEIQENQIEIERQEESIGKLTTEIAKTTDTKEAIEVKIKNQEKTVNDLRQMLKMIEGF